MSNTTVRVADELAAKSDLTEDDARELSEQLKRDIAEHYRDE